MSSADTIFERECPFVQDGYIIQPYLLCLDWEARMFMYRGVLMSGVITSRTVGGKMNVVSSSRKCFNVTSGAPIIEIMFQSSYLSIIYVIICFLFLL